MKNSQDFNQIETIRELILTIARLMKERQKEWLSWNVVARELKGSDGHVEFLSGLAQLPDYRKYFSVFRNKVTLSVQGQQFAANMSKQPPTFIKEIADAVTKYASTLWPLKLEVTGIATIAAAGQRFVHAVHIETMDDVIASETPVDLVPKSESTFYGSKYRGKIVGREPDGSILYIAFESKIVPACLPAYIRIDRGYLLGELADQLNSLSGCPQLVAQIFDGKNAEAVSVVSHQDSLNVADRLAKLATPWTRFLWGPPGAGKTFALGRMIIQLLRDESAGRILLIAPSNRAVDVAVEQLVAQLEDSDIRHVLDGRRILRFGYPRKTTVLQRPELLGPSVLDKLTLKIKKLSTQIEKAERNQDSEDKIAVLKAERLEAQEEVKKAVHEHVKQSLVVATTTTMAYMKSSPILDVAWDTVLIDEVTMVPPAMCTFLGSLAKKRLLLAGDPRQLGPVYEENRRSTAETKHWMGRDIFEVSGVSSGDGNSREIKVADFRLTRITSQRRCATKIWAAVKHLYPEVKNAVNQQRLDGLVDLSPLPGKSVVLLDTSEGAGDARCEQEHQSWRNKHTAALAMQIVSKMLAEANREITIAIISAYRAQTRLLQQLIRTARKKNSKYKLVEAGTVHQFQGSDADIVIFDLVDGPTRSKPGKLLQGDAGIRLVNVAVTRARGKVVILANKTWFQKAGSKIDNPLLWSLIVDRPRTECLRVSLPVLKERPKPREQKETKNKSVKQKNVDEQTKARTKRQSIDLSQVKPQKLDLSQKDFSGANLSGENLSGIDLNFAILCKANLSQATLSKAKLCGVNLQNADLRGASLNLVDLRGADLRWADLRGANLRGVHHLDTANLKGARCDSLTEWPPNFQPRSAGVIIEDR